MPFQNKSLFRGYQLHGRFTKIDFGLARKDEKIRERREKILSATDHALITD
jgi:hypothetical protein